MLYKNNSEMEIVVHEYKCMHEVLGSDHRPVVLSFKIKNFSHPQYYDLPQMLRPKQGLGKIDIEFIIVEALNLVKIPAVTQKLQFG